MSHEYAPYGESSKAGQPPQTPEREGGNDFARPNFMTVGSGHTSEYAQRLTAMLDHDSGYGSSIGDSSSARGWDLSIGEDRPTPPHTPDRYSNKNDCTCSSQVTSSSPSVSITNALQSRPNEEPWIVTSTSFTTTTIAPLLVAPFRELWRLLGNCKSTIRNGRPTIHLSRFRSLQRQIDQVSSTRNRRGLRRPSTTTLSAS